jgi:cellulose synthase/poly-beta-1,6-N-acetylglucosamine synthase-like glycosyltransferase
MEIDLSKLKNKKFMIATPMYGGMSTFSYTGSMIKLVALCHRYGIDFGFEFLYNESLITRARNNLSRLFLEKKDYDVMIFIDADIEFHAEDVIALFYLAATESDKGIVGAPYPTKAIKWDLIYKAMQRGDINSEEDLKNNSVSFVGDFFVDERRTIFLDRPEKIGELGTGFMAIRRDTLEKIIEANPDRFYVSGEAPSYGSETFDFFPVGIDRSSNRYISEDYAFCKMAREAGVQPWILPWIQLNHFGSYIFEGSFSNFLKNVS